MASPDYYPLICLTEQHDGAHVHVEHSESVAHVHMYHSYSVPPPGKHVHAKHGASAQYAVDCCAGPMCNNATAWPDLPGVPSGVDKEVL